MAGTGFIAKLIGDLGADKLISTLGDQVDRFVTTKAEKEELKRAIANDVRLHELEFLKDKQNAREMYKSDSWLQKIYALVFLIAYMILTCAMLFIVYQMAINEVSVPEWAIAFISTIWGGMSTKVGTITDFLFGSSQGSHKKDDSIIELKKDK